MDLEPLIEAADDLDNRLKGVVADPSSLLTRRRNRRLLAAGALTALAILAGLLMFRPGNSETVQISADSTLASTSAKRRTSTSATGSDPSAAPLSWSVPSSLVATTVTAPTSSLVPPSSVDLSTMTAPMTGTSAQLAIDSTTTTTTTIPAPPNDCYTDVKSVPCSAWMYEPDPPADTQGSLTIALAGPIANWGGNLDMTLDMADSDGLVSFSECSDFVKVIGPGGETYRVADSSPTPCVPQCSSPINPDIAGVSWPVQPQSSTRAEKLTVPLMANGVPLSTGAYTVIAEVGPPCYDMWRNRMTAYSSFTIAGG